MRIRLKSALAVLLPVLLAAAVLSCELSCERRRQPEPKPAHPIFGASSGQTRPPVMGASGTGHASGLAPDPGSSAGSAKYLREDATWAVPPGGGGSNVLGSKTINALALGCDPTGTADSSVLIQAALDAAVDAGALAGGTNNTHIRLYFPSGTYKLLSPIWLYDNIEVCGEGLTSRVSTSNVGTFPFMAWRLHEQAPLPGTFATDHRFDLFGILDSSAAPTANQRWGLSTASPSTGAGPDQFPAFWGTPIDKGRGDRWYGTQKLTLSIALRSQDNANLGNGLICGMGVGQSNGGPGPWTLWAGADGGADSAFHFYFRTYGSSTIRDFSFGSRLGSGVRRIDVAVDFTANDGSGLCKLYAAVDGVQQTVARGYGTRLTVASGGEPSFTATDAIHFSESTLNVFAFAALALQLNSCPTNNAYANYDLLGLRLYDDWIYADNGGGIAQARVDAGTINDLHRYFDPTLDNAHVIAWLPLTEAPNTTTKTSNRQIQCNHGGATVGLVSWGFYCWNENHVGTGAPMGNVRFRDISISGDGYWGASILFLNAFSAGTDDIEALGGWWGIQANGGYDYRFTGHLTANGRDAAFCAQSILGRMEAPFRSAAGRTLFRLNACQFSARDIKLADLNSFGQTTEAVIRLHGSQAYGSNYRFDYIETDNENSTGPSVALVWADRHNTGGFATYLSLGEIQHGNAGGSALIFLDDAVASGGSGTGFCTVDRIEATDGNPTIQVNGPNWECVVRDSYPIPDRESVKLVGGFAGPPFVKIKQRMRALPKAGRILAGTWYVELWNPAAGGVAEYVCTASGTAAWDSTYTYAVGTYASFGGVEYKALAQNSNSQPPNANWQTLGAVSAPVWKALTTVAP